MHGPVYTGHFVQVQGLLVYRNVVSNNNPNRHVHNGIQRIRVGDPVFHGLEGIQIYSIITPERRDLESHQIVAQIIGSRTTPAIRKPRPARRPTTSDT